MLDSLLPPTSTPQELALEQAIRPGNDVRAAVDLVRTSKELMPDSWLPFLIWEYGLEELLPYFADQRALIAAGIPWLRIRGTPQSLLTALGWLGYGAPPTVEEEEPLGARWFEYMIDPGGVTNCAAELEKIMALAQLSAPVGTRLARVMHGYDVRRMVLDYGNLDDRLLSDYSGWRAPETGLVVSFGRVIGNHLYLGKADAQTITALSTKAMHLRYEDRPLLDFMRISDTAIPNREIVHYHLFTGHFHGTDAPLQMDTGVQAKASVILSDGWILGVTNTVLPPRRLVEIGGPMTLSGSVLGEAEWSLAYSPIDERFDKTTDSHSISPANYLAQTSGHEKIFAVQYDAATMYNPVEDTPLLRVHAGHSELRGQFWTGIGWNVAESWDSLNIYTRSNHYGSSY